MSKKIDNIAKSPSWAEVTLGAALSVGLGVVLGVVLLVFRPIIVAKETPKEKDLDRKAVYYIEGTRDVAKAKQALAKRKTFVEGKSIAVTEDEINSLFGPAPGAPGAPKAGEKAKTPDKKSDGKEKVAEKAAPPAAGTDDLFAVGTPNFRIRESRLQLGVPVTINALGLGQKVIVQARGGFAKNGDAFTFEPESLYVGSCPVQRLPFVAGFVRGKFLAASAIPEDIKASWPKLTNVAIEGDVLKLTMP
ncbi:MAG: hypothetical protein EXS37_14460 [Opitutus sp.]|nr:hypothetical protein [Opitutus sp.]